MSKITLKVGNDNGNSEHDIIVNNKLIKQPNVFAKVAKLPNLDEVNKEYVLENIQDNLIVSFEGGLYYIGQNALKSGNRCRNIEVGVDNNKINSEIVFINTLAQIAGFAVQSKYSKDKEMDLIKIDVDMTTSLPVAYYNKKNANMFAEKFMEKKHKVNVFLGDEEISTEIKFTYVKVIPEGVTAMFSLIENINKELENKRVLHIAIGEGTTEFPVTYGITFNPDFIDGTYNGVGQAIDSVIEDFKKQKGLLKFTRQDYSNVIKNPAHKYYDLAMEFIEPAIENEAEDILHMAKKVIQKANNEIDYVCIYGGGSILMRNTLEPKLKTFCERAGIDTCYLENDLAVTIESEGLYIFTESEIFKVLKENYNQKE